MWGTVPLVSSGFALAAFIAAVAAWSYTNKGRERERLIRAADSRERAELVRNTLEFFHVNTEGLTREQQFEIAIRQIQARSTRFRITSVLVAVIGTLSAGVAIWAIARGSAQPRPIPEQPLCEYRSLKSLGWESGHKTNFCKASGYNLGMIGVPGADYKAGGACVRGSVALPCQQDLEMRLDTDLYECETAGSAIRCFARKP